MSDKDSQVPLAAEAAFKPCGLIPTYNNPATLRQVVLRVLSFVDCVIVVDDGSEADGSKVCQALAEEGIVDLVVRPHNGGKGAAVKDGLRRAAALGFSHALQVDADGQHTIEDAPKLLAQAESNPGAAVLACPIFDESAPKLRLAARKITYFWINVQTGGKVITDAMCGFRVYPVAATQRLSVWGDGMDFDPEIAVKLYWSGAQIINVPTKVRYVPEEEGGVSNFRMGKDNLLITWMHFRLCALGLVRFFLGRGK